MEISKALQEEILTVQNKLKNAIRDHQIRVGKLKDDPNNSEILGQIQQIQLHIVSLGRCQKQVVQRLRKEVEAFKAENAANGVKVSIASLLGFNNNNHITNNNEKKIKEEKENDVVQNGLDCRPTKEDYEDEVVRNGDDCPSPQEDIKIKERSSSVETVSYEDDVVEISTEERSPEKKPDVKEISLECSSKAQLAFLNVLGLITTSKYSELQSKRAERKRRSTANPQFVYSSLELPTKRKRYSYLQSAGNAPQTRQTTARLNGPSPPPAGNAGGKVSSISSKSSTSPPAKNLTSKSLIATQKSTVRPNILRSAMESKVYSDISKSRNETNNQIPSAKSVQNVGNKAVHIPGLPSSLTIERVESDVAVCVRCRKPGHLSICENCSTNFHVACHPGSTENPSSKLCPKCNSSSTSKTKEQDDLLPCKKEEEDIVATTYASRITGEAREDTKVYKTACGFYKVDATTKRSNFVTSALSINQLPSSTFLIPITTKNVHAGNAGFGNVNSHVQQQDNNPGEFEQQKKPQWQQKQRHQCDKSDLCYNFTYKPTDYSKKPKHNSEKQQQQSYLIVQKVRDGGGVTKVESVTYQQQQQQQQQRLSEKPRCKGGDISIRKSPVFVAAGNAAIGRRFNKQQQQQQQSANRIILPKKPSGSASAERAFNGRKARILRQPRKHGIENIGKEGHGNARFGRNGSADEKKDTEPRKYRAKFSLLHSLFASYNKPDLVADDYKQSEVDNEREREDQGDNEPDRDGNHTAKSEEHVKLEEAHLSAPFGTELVNQGDDQIVREHEKNELEGNIAADKTFDDRGDDNSELKDDNMEFLKHEREYYMLVGSEKESSCDRQSQDCEVVSSRRSTTEISVPHENQDLKREGMESRICQASV